MQRNHVRTVLTILIRPMSTRNAMQYRRGRSKGEYLILPDLLGGIFFYH